MNPVRKAVIPAAGYGNRMLPATYAIPKEMLPVAGKPLIQYAVEEASKSGIEEVILVLSKGKETTLEHLRRLVSSSRTMKLPTIHIVWQQVPRGLADAILTAREFIPEKSFAVILPDVLIDSEVPCITQLIQGCDENARCIIATRKVESSKTGCFGILELAEDVEHSTRTVQIKSLIERPAPHEAPSSYGIYGRYILPAEIFDCIENTRPGYAAELQLTDAINLLARKAPTCGVLFDGIHYDAGNHLEFLEASVAFALKNSVKYPGLPERLENLLQQRRSPQQARARLAS